MNALSPIDTSCTWDFSRYQPGAVLHIDAKQLRHRTLAAGGVSAFLCEIAARAGMACSVRFDFWRSEYVVRIGARHAG